MLAKKNLLKEGLNFKYNFFLLSCSQRLVFEFNIAMTKIIVFKAAEGGGCLPSKQSP